MRILIAGGQAPNRAALRLLLGERRALEVAAEATDSTELLANLSAGSCDVVLLDWELPGLPAADLLSALHRLYERLSVIVLSGRPELEAMARAAGADAFFSMCDPPKRLVETLQALGERSLEARDAAADDG